jgi:class 3 adenylate cyclase/tetratricopeptide (TPR) repeat protein
VLFADVKGSLELAEQVDPEEWHRILDRFFQILADGVHRFEGTVNQYTGDGIMALFGAPIAHEDHAQRACYAALHLGDEIRRYADELRLEHGLNFSVRMGLNSGEVVVGKIGDDLRMDYTAQGQSVGLAARMQQIAEPRSIYLTEHTAKLVEGFFELREIGASRVRGVEEEVHIHELEGIGPLRTRFDVSRARGLSKFVGRGDEMAALETALERAVEGHGQVLGVVGEAGVGKSRLCFEFAQRCRARNVAVREAHGVSHGKALPLLPVLELLRAIFGIGDRDSDREARQKIAGAMVLLDRELESGIPLVFELLGVSDPGHPAPAGEPEARRRQLFEIFRRLVRARSGREPAVFLLEDLHWLDTASETFLENLVEAVAGTRTLLLVNFRPEYRAGWMQRSTYQQLSLLPLGAEAVRELLRATLGSDPSLAGLADRLFSHTAGNPFFVEEGVRSLVEAGYLEGAPGSYRLARPVDSLAIPATVQAVLAARIDRLAEREKQLLQTASVIGKRFAEPVLSRVAGLPDRDRQEALRVLIAAEFLYEEALYPEAEYAFAHPLTQEVAYGSQLGDRRRSVHAAVARALEELATDRVDESAALLAHHWEAAGNRLVAARWHQRAAAWAGITHAAAALRHLHKLRELLAGVPESPETIALGIEARSQTLLLGVRAGLLEEDVEELLAEGEELAARSGEPRARAFFRLAYGTYRLYEGPVSEGTEILRESVRLADGIGDPALRMAARRFLHTAAVFSGSLTESLVLADEVIELHERSPGLGVDLLGYDFHPIAVSWRGWTLAVLGRAVEGAEALRRAGDLARRSGDVGALAVVEAQSAQVAWFHGDGPAALAHGRRGVELAERFGAATTLGLAYSALGFACVLEERWTEALEALERAVERGIGLSALMTGAAVSRAWLGMGDERRARSAAEEAVSATRRAGARLLESMSQVSLARVLIRSEGASARSEVEHALSRALELAQELGYRVLLPQIHEVRSDLMRALGDGTRRERELREAHRLYTEMGATGHADRLAKELGL